MNMKRAALALILAAAMAMQMGSVAFAKSLSLSKPKTEAVQETESSKKKSDTKKTEEKEEEAEPENYWVSQLNETERKIYDQLLEGLQKGESSITITMGKTTAKSRDALFKKLLNIVLKQHPEFYWLENQQGVSWKVSDKQSIMTFKPAYSSGYNQSEVKKKDASLTKLVEDMKKDLPKEESAKVKYIYNWILNRSTYDWNEFYAYNRTGAPTKGDDYSIVGIMLNKSATCQGYANSFQYLCDQLGVECITVDGIGNYGNGNMAHAWNYVKVDGNWYLVDTTWGDTFSGGQNFALLGSESMVTGYVNVGKAYTPNKNGYFTYPELSKKAYSAK